MNMTDPIGDMLTRIRNGQAARLTEIESPASKLRASLLEVLKREGYIRDFSVKQDGSSNVINIELKYSGYVAKDRAAVSRIQQLDQYRIPPNLDYSGLHSLSHESREKLQAIRPESLGQASRVPGVSPSDIQNLVSEIARQSSCFT